MPKHSVLILHHTLNPPGGGSSLSAWVIQTLAETYDVTVRTWEPTRVADVDRGFGTQLAHRPIRWTSVSPFIRNAVNWVPLRLALLTSNILFLTTKHHCRTHHYDAVLSTMNEGNIGFPMIQYVHYPSGKFPRPKVDYRWYHFAFPLWIYRKLSAGLSGFDKQRIAANRTLVNSDWTGRLFAEWYGVVPQTVYPPVPGGFPDVPFAQRRRGFVCAGRIAPEKELGKLIDILARVRQRGHAITFAIIGPVIGQGEYAREIQRLSEPHRDWISFQYELSRAEMASRITEHRYGIHGMVGEHFGISVAELQRAGCITFVPDDGGPVEIVGHDERVIYHSIDDAVDKIDRVLSDPAFEEQVRQAVMERRDRFTEVRFAEEIHAVVDAFIASQATTAHAE